MALGTLTAPSRPERLPVGSDGQLSALEEQLRWCRRALQAAMQDTSNAMRSEQLSDRERWSHVRGLRTLAWKVVREVLPLTERIPTGLRGSTAHTECLRVAHALRRDAEAALATNTNFTVDLLNGHTLPGRTW
ncbi:hypothetical protein [Euzebya tangerina]|uniref:hypothetical protein n=1 Tax=Euzebya tangerina TaxID=591198 RepID=UPI000E31CB5C|nr:hypothetical protein [Euzebya tangerina]